MLIENARGNFTFIKGIGPFSAGVRAHEGFAIVYAAFRPFAPLLRGYELVENHLRELGRPLTRSAGCSCGFRGRFRAKASRSSIARISKGCARGVLRLKARIRSRIS